VLAVKQGLKLREGLDPASSQMRRKMIRSMVRWTAKFSSWTSRAVFRTARLRASASRHFSISAKNSASTVAVPRLRSETTYLSKEPLRTASFEKIEAISPQ